jgi:hypothetical protein
MIVTELFNGAWIFKAITWYGYIESCLPRRGNKKTTRVSLVTFIQNWQTLNDSHRKWNWGQVWFPTQIRKCQGRPRSGNLSNSFFILKRNRAWSYCNGHANGNNATTNQYKSMQNRIGIRQIEMKHLTSKNGKGQKGDARIRWKWHNASACKFSFLLLYLIGQGWKRTKSFEGVGYLLHRRYTFEVLLSNKCRCYRLLHLLCCIILHHQRPRILATGNR